MNTQKTKKQSPQSRLRHHVTGAIELGEKSPIVAVTGEGNAPRFELTQQDSGFWNVRDRGTLIRTEVSLEEWEVIQAELERQESLIP